MGSTSTKGSQTPEASGRRPPSRPASGRDLLRRHGGLSCWASTCSRRGTIRLRTAVCGATPLGSLHPQIVGDCREGYLPDRISMETRGTSRHHACGTTADLLRSLWRPHALAAADAMAHAGLVSREEVMSYISTMRRYPGIIQARALARLIEPKTESPGESHQRLRLIDAGFPIPQSQFIVTDLAGFLVHDSIMPIPRRESGPNTTDVSSIRMTSQRSLKRPSGGTSPDILRWRLAIGTYERIFGTTLPSSWRSATGSGSSRGREVGEAA